MKVATLLVVGAVLGVVLARKLKKDPIYPPQDWKLRIG